MSKIIKLLILCTGNSCRSQMAEGFLNYLDSNLEVYSAGTVPSEKIHPLAVKVMAEKGIDISLNKPKNVSDFIDIDFDYVITVCDEAKEVCPVFTGKVKHKLHIGFDDPATVSGNNEYILSEFVRVRNEIELEFRKLYKEIVTIKF